MPWREFPVDENDLVIPPKVFEDFKRELNKKGRVSVYNFLEIQEFAYDLTRQYLEARHDLKGNQFSIEQIHMLELITAQIVRNVKKLQEENSCPSEKIDWHNENNEPH